jgi:nucleoside triphosphate pyrophosphatase
MSAVVLILASASPARLATLRSAGIEPIVEVSGVDESLVQEGDPARLAMTLARLKGLEVAARHQELPPDPRTLVLGCDSVLEVDGIAYGKPESPREAVERLRALRGRDAILHTGHHLTDLTDLSTGTASAAVASTRVVFGSFSDEEIDAYVDTGEPLEVAGAFTIDGLGGAFVERVEGDPHNVVGLSLPLLRRMVGQLGIGWHQMWNRTRPEDFGSATS